MSLRYEWVHFLVHTRPDEAKALFDRLDRREDPMAAWEAVFGSADAVWAAAYRAWLVDHQNDDGGWGDTVLSISNISCRRP